MSTGGTSAIVPVKCFQRGKSRLASALAPTARMRLARGLFERVVGVLGACPELSEILVVTDCVEVAALARRRGAIACVTSLPLRAGVDAALTVLAGRGAEGALVLMADLPQIEARDVSDLARLLHAHELVVAPDERDEGTNALALRPRGGMATCFGAADSFSRHLARARAHSLGVAVYRNPRLAFDVDTPRDLARL